MPSHLLILSHILQKSGRRTTIPVSQSVDVCGTCEALLLPHPESSFFRGDGLGEVTVNDDLRDTVLFSDADSRYLSLADEGSDRFG